MTENEIGTRVIEAAIAVHRKLGYLLNFVEEVMRTGITRCVNGLEEQPLRPCTSAGEEKVQHILAFRGGGSKLGRPIPEAKWKGDVKIMRKVRSWAIICAVALAATMNANALDLMTFGKAQAVVIVDEASTPVAKRMARELTDYLQKITGAEFKIAKAPVAGMKTIRIDTPYDKSLLTGGAPKNDEFAVFVNRKGELEFTGDKPRGAVFAVWAFLESLGCRFWAPDQETIPTVKKLSIPNNFKLVEAPAVDWIRGVWGEPVLHATWASKCRLNSAMNCLPKELGGEEQLAIGETLVLQYLKPDQYFATHPEWYTFRDGKREKSQLCMTNEGMLKQLAEEIREDLEKHPGKKSVSVGVNDNDRFCQCDPCTEFSKKHGSLNALSLHVANYVATALESTHPDVVVTLLAYWTPAVPQSMKGHKNVLCALAEKINLYGYGPLTSHPHWKDLFRGWAKQTPQGVHVWNYYANFWNYMVPFCDYLDMGGNFKIYKACGVRSVSTQMPWGILSDMVDLRGYLFGRLLWNPDLDDRKMIAEWVAGTCGKGAGPIQEYIALQEKLRKLGGQDFRSSAAASDYIECYKLVKRALDLTTGDESSHKRIRKIYTGLAVEMMECYDEKKLADTAKLKRVELPTRKQLFDQIEAFGRETTKLNGAGELMIAWKEGQWNFDTYLNRFRKSFHEDGASPTGCE